MARHPTERADGRLICKARSLVGRHGQAGNYIYMTMCGFTRDEFSTDMRAGPVNCGACRDKMEKATVVDIEGASGG